MELLISGLFLWSIVHFIPSIGISLKTTFISRFGAKVYAAGFSLLILLALVLIVFGWRSTVPTYLYTLPAIVKPIGLFMLVVAFILLGAAQYQTRIKRLVRHPQLTGLIVWSAAHLLLNGDSRSVVLFGGLGCWAIMEILLINKRDGLWVKPEAPAWAQEIKGGLISLVVFAVVIFLHPFIAGVPVQ